MKLTTIATSALAVLAALTGCQQQPTPPSKTAATTKAAAAKAATDKAATDKAAQVELPQLPPRPTLPEAARVLDIFFTANAVGEVEPCG